MKLNLYFDEAMETLKRVSVIFMLHGNPVTETVPFEEWSYALNYSQMDSLSVEQKPGSWVRVTSRLYRGAIGQLVSVDVASTTAKVDLIP